MVAQFGYLQASTRGLDSSLRSLAVISFAALVGGIAGITAVIYVATKAASEWETSLTNIARMGDINKDTVEGMKKYISLSKEMMSIEVSIPGANRQSLENTYMPLVQAGLKDQDLTGVATQILKAKSILNSSEDDLAKFVVQLAKLNPGSVEAAGSLENFVKKTFSSINETAKKYVIKPEELVKTMTETAGSYPAWGLKNDIPGQAALMATMSQFGVNLGTMRSSLMSSVSTPGLAGSSVGRLDNDILRALGLQATEQKVSKTGKVTEKEIDYNKSEVAGKMFGMNSEQFQAYFDKNGPIAMLELMDKIGQQNLTNIQKAALASTLVGGRAGYEFTKLASGGAAINTYKEARGVAQAGYDKGTSIEDAYEAYKATFGAQSELTGQIWAGIKQTIGAITLGPMTNMVTGLNEKLSGVYSWLNKIVDSSRNANGLIDWGKAWGNIIDDVKQKFVDLGGVDFLKGAGIGVGVAVLATGLSGLIGPAANAARALASMGVAAATAVGKFILLKAQMVFSGIAAAVTTMGTLGRSIGLAGTSALVATGQFIGLKLAVAGSWASGIVSAFGTIVAAIGALAVPLATVALGLAAIGYSLDPGKFTTFNKIATDAFNGIKVVVTDVYTAIMAGDFSGAAIRLKTAFQDAWTYAKGIDWASLGSEIGTMIGDGLQAVVSTAISIGTWIYNELKGWADAGGPYQLGSYVATKVGEGIKWLLTGSNFWDSLSRAFGAVSNWLSLGWNIISQIGSGLVSGVSGAIAPVARYMLVEILTVTNQIEIEFAQTWNTIVVAAFNAVSGITSAFSGLGSKLSQQLQPVLDIINKLSGASPLSYYNPDSGAKFTPEQYNALPRERQSGTNPVYANPNAAYGMNQPAMSEAAVEAYNTGLIQRGTKGFTPTSSTTWGNSDMQYAGYETGGTGFTWNELIKVGNGIAKTMADWSKEGGFAFKNGNESTSAYMETWRGDTVTQSGKEKVQKEDWSTLSKFLVDFKHDARWSAEQTADSLFGASEKFGNKVDSSAQVWEQAAKSSKEYLTLATQEMSTELNTGFERAVLGADEMASAFREALSGANVATQAATQSASIAIANGGNQAGQYLTSAARNSLAIGNQVGQAFTNGGNAVRIGLDASGRQIAIIGQVAQQQFAASGGQWVNSVGQTGVTIGNGGNTAKNALQLGGSTAQGSMVAGGSSIQNACASGASAIASAAMSMAQIASSGGRFQFQDKTGSGGGTPIGVQGAGVNWGWNGSSNGVNAQNSEINFNGADMNGNFTDLACTGETVLVNGLKYTNPQGQTTYIDPMNYNENGGITPYQGSGAAKKTTAATIKTSDYVNDQAIKTSQYTTNNAKQVADYQLNNAYTSNMLNEQSNTNWAATTSNAATGWTFAVDTTRTNLINTERMKSSIAMDSTIKQSNVMTTANYAGSNAIMGSSYAVTGSNTALVGTNTQLVGTNKAIAVNVSALSAAAEAVNTSAAGMKAAAASMSSVGGGSWGGSGSYGSAFGNSWKSGGAAGVGVRQANEAQPSWMPSWTWQARGGVFSKPTVIGVGEAGTEIVLPADISKTLLGLVGHRPANPNKTDTKSSINLSLPSTLAGNNAQNNGSATIEVPLYLDGKIVARATAKYMVQDLQTKGIKVRG